MPDLSAQHLSYAIDAFFKHMMEIDGLRPFGSSVSSFHAACRPATKRLDITVRVRWNFTGNWTGMDQGQFKQDCRQQIAKYWNGTYALRYTRSDGGPPAEVVPFFKLVDDDTSPHYTMEIKSSALVPQSFVGYDNGTRKCCLFRGAEHDVQQKMMTRIAYGVGARGKAAAGALKATGNIDGRNSLNILRQANRVVSFATGDKKPDAAGMQALDDIADIIRQKLPIMPTPPLVLTGYTAKSEPAALGMERAQAVQTLLAQKGVPPLQLQVTTGGVFKRRFRFAIKAGFVDVSVDKNAASAMVHKQHAFPITAHEFGHMLGLIDEYLPENGDPGDASAIAAMRSLCTQNGIEMPEFNLRGTSLMSWGYQVLPCHFTPMLYVLKELKQQFVTTGHLKRLLRQRFPGIAPEMVDFDLGNPIRTKDSIPTKFLLAVDEKLDPLPRKRIQKGPFPDYFDWARGAYHWDTNEDTDWARMAEASLKDYRA